MDERWEAVTGTAVNLLYCAVLVALAVTAVPPLRAAVAAQWQRQLHAWRYGRWLAGQTRAPRWTELLQRDDLPAEAGPA